MITCLSKILLKIFLLLHIFQLKGKPNLEYLPIIHLRRRLLARRKSTRDVFYPETKIVAYKGIYPDESIYWVVCFFLTGNSDEKRASFWHGEIQDYPEIKPFCKRVVNKFVKKAPVMLYGNKSFSSCLLMKWVLDSTLKKKFLFSYKYDNV